MNRRSFLRGLVAVPVVVALAPLFPLTPVLPRSIRVVGNFVDMDDGSALISGWWFQWSFHGPLMFSVDQLRQIAKQHGTYRMT